MEPADFLARIRAEAAHIAAFAADRDLDAAVPSCPGMTAGDVIRHLGGVHRRVSAQVRTGAAPHSWERTPPPGTDLVSWFREGAAALHDELARHHPDEPRGTFWAPDLTAGGWSRRMAHEITVHRADVELAYGPIGPIDQRFAADGADEVLAVLLAGLRRDGTGAPSGICAPSGTGVPSGAAGTAGAGGTAGSAGAGESGPVVGVAAGPHLWRVVLRSASAEVTRELPDDADAVVMGDPVAVYLWLWGRRGDDAIRVCGDRTAAAALRAAVATVTG